VVCVKIGGVNGGAIGGVNKADTAIFSHISPL
jgi:hypothetical protein